MNVCYYCGEPADSIDHVIPLSLIRDLADDPEALNVAFGTGRVLEVDCCRDCNSRLSNIYDANLHKRKERLRLALRRKYKRLLEMPDWTDTELGSMNGWLQGSVILDIAKKAWIERRLRYVGPATVNGMLANTGASKAKIKKAARRRAVGKR